MLRFVPAEYANDKTDEGQSETIVVIFIISKALESELLYYKAAR